MEETTFRVKHIVRLWHNCDITTSQASRHLARLVPSGSTVYATLLDEIFRLHALSLDALLTTEVNDAL